MPTIVDFHQIDVKIPISPDSWSSPGVTDILDPMNPGTDEVENRIATLPTGTNGKRFVRLRVSRP